VLDGLFEGHGHGDRSLPPSQEHSPRLYQQTGGDKKRHQGEESGEKGGVILAWIGGWQ